VAFRYRTNTLVVFSLLETYSPLTMASTKYRRTWLIGTNACMMLGWMRVLRYFLIVHYKTHMMSIPGINHLPICNDQFVSMVDMALMISFLEAFNSLTGMTRSKSSQVLLFAIIRMGVEKLVAPKLSTCPTAWSHVITVMCWSLGDTIRFGCFFFDSAVANGSRWAKYVRYTVGPILFPLGTLGEMVMVLTMANQTYRTSKVYSIAMYIAALCLWPIGFYSLFTQLLRQRRKFLQNVAISERGKKLQ
jgi:hypothetical protein